MGSNCPCPSLARAQQYLAPRHRRPSGCPHTQPAPPPSRQVLYGADLDSGEVGSGFPRAPPLGNK